MPMHDWTRVRPEIYHHFHGRWIFAIANALNLGGLSKGYYALTGIPKRQPRSQRRLSIRRATGHRMVALVELISPGNKAGRQNLASFVGKAITALGLKIHLLVIDPFPPGRRDPNGVHAAIREELADQHIDRLNFKMPEQFR